MKTYIARFVHKIAPKDTDTQVVQLDPSKLQHTKELAAELRRAQLLLPGQRLREWRAELGGRIVAFPAASIWHSIIIEETEETKAARLGVSVSDLRNQVRLADEIVGEIIAEEKGINP